MKVFEDLTGNLRVGQEAEDFPIGNDRFLSDLKDFPILLVFSKTL